MMRAFLLFIFLVGIFQGQNSFALTITNVTKQICCFELENDFGRSNACSKPQGILTLSEFPNSVTEFSKADTFSLKWQCGNSPFSPKQVISRDDIVEIHIPDSTLTPASNSSWTWTFAEYSFRLSGYIAAASAGVLIGLQQGEVLGDYYGALLGPACISHLPSEIQILIKPAVTTATRTLGVVAAQSAFGVIGAGLAPLLADLAFTGLKWASKKYIWNSQERIDCKVSFEKDFSHYQWNLSPDGFYTFEKAPDAGSPSRPFITQEP